MRAWSMRAVHAGGTCGRDVNDRGLRDAGTYAANVNHPLNG